jgi:prevent-host-death family protein
MARFGVAETKNRLSELLDVVASGETVEITRHGKTIAHLVPPVQAQSGTANIDWVAKRDAAMARLAALRASMPYSDVSSVDLIRQMRDEGP